MYTSGESILPKLDSLFESDIGQQPQCLHDIANIVTFTTRLCRNTCVVLTSSESFLPTLDFLFEIDIQQKRTTEINNLPPWAAINRFRTATTMFAGTCSLLLYLSNNICDNIQLFCCLFKSSFTTLTLSSSLPLLYRQLSAGSVTYENIDVRLSLVQILLVLLFWWRRF